MADNPVEEITVGKTRKLGRWWESSWSLTRGALAVSALGIIFLAVTGAAVGISGGFAYWGASVLTFLGFHPADWLYFQERLPADLSLRAHSFLPYTVLLIGIITGSLLSSLLSSEFRIRTIKRPKMLAAALLGGFLMGVGARLAYGCNIGNLLGGIASLSLHGWVFAVFLILGTYLGVKLLLRYLM